MYLFRKLLVWAGLASILTLTAFGQGTAFTYQGRLNDGANPANGIYDLRFTIYDLPSAGTPQGNIITNTATAVSNGLFTVMLDFGNQFPGGAGRWLEIGARTNGNSAFVTLAPRQEFTATPYSIQSANSATAASAQSVLAENITGTLAAGQLPSGIVTNGASGVSISGAFTGNGSGLTNVPGTLPWQVVAGTSVTAAANQAYLLTNGSTTAVTLPTNANTGDIVTISGDGGSGWQVLTTSGQVIVDQNSPPLWTNNNNAPMANWSSVASSADGSKFVAVVKGGQIYTSSDSGMTWSAQTNAPAASWNSVASSADGTKLVAVNGGGQIYTSGDSGSHWSVATNIPSVNWVSVVSSADGAKLAAAEGNLVFTSTNSGANWSSSTVQSGISLVSLASSSDDTKLVATWEGGPPAPPPTGIDTSTNSGVSWFFSSLNPPVGFTGYAWVSVASSFDGVKLVAVDGSQGLIYTSANSGATWLQNGNFPSVQWRSVASSADGTKLVTVASGSYGAIKGGIYTSTDSGATWLANNAPVTNWQSVASSADGTRMVAAVSGGQLWTAVEGIGTQFAGAAGTTAQFQYLGNGVWQPAGVAASQITGTLPSADLPANVVVNGETGVTLSGALSGTFSGNGGGLTGLNASQLTSGTVADALLSANVALRAGGNNFTGTQTVTNGNVGIATTSPGRLLQIGSSSNPADALINLGCGTGGGVARSWEVGVPYGTNNSTGDYYSFTIRDANAGADRMVIRWDTGNVGIGTNNPGLNNVQINPTFETANGYGLVVCKTNFGENIQVNESAGGGGIGLVVDDALQGDDTTSLLLVRNNVASSPQNLLTVGAGGTVVMSGNCFIGGICSAGLFNTTSDRNAKENFQSVSAAEVLSKVSALPIQEWNFKTDTVTRHIGPMAQDFFAAFGVGTDDKHIATVDEDGVALAAIQGLNEKVEGRSQKAESQIEELKAENAELKARLEKLERIMDARKGDE